MREFIEWKPLVPVGVVATAPTLDLEALSGVGSPLENRGPHWWIISDTDAACRTTLAVEFRRAPGSNHWDHGSRTSQRWVFQKETARVDMLRWSAKRERPMIHDDAQLMLVAPLDTSSVRADARWALLRGTLDHPSNRFIPHGRRHRE